MAIIISKTIPTSSWYTGSGYTSITLNSVSSIEMNTKKSLIKNQIAKSTSSAESTGSDNGINYVRDLKKIEDTIKIKGWLIDTTDSSAWTKAWKLRAMTTVSGPISLVIENLTFNSATVEAFLEEATWIAYPARTLGLTINNTSSSSLGKTRIEIDLGFYLGDSR